MERVLVVGLDGATWNLLRPWMKEGHLPTFRRLMDEGAYGVLESTIPPVSIPAWNSLVTGKNPGKLGIFSFMSKDLRTCDFRPDFLYTQHRCIWDILGETGKKVLVVNVPCVHRAYKVNGYLVVGFLYIDKNSLTYPGDLRRKLDEVTGGYEVDVLDTDEVFETIESRFDFVKYLVRKEGRTKYLERVHTIIEKRFKAVEFLLKEEWDFAFVVFVAPDRVQHRFWENERTLLDVYKRLDSKLEKLLAIAGEETTVIIVSDHGFGPKGRVFNLNEWLLKEGYLRLKRGNNPRPRKTSNLIRALRILPYIKSWANLLPFRIQRFFRQKINFTRVSSSVVDWQMTRVFTQPSDENFGDLYLNFQDKKSNGTIDPITYKRITDEVVQKLRNLRDPKTGKRISASVFEKHEIYVGEHLNKAPDLVILIDDNIHGFDTTIGHDQIFESGEGGEHRMQGIFFARGPNIKRGTEAKGTRIYDITPTVLHILNLPIPDDVNGKVLEEIFSEGSEPAKRAIKYSVTRIAKDGSEDLTKPVGEEEIKKRLQRLGYV